MNLRALVKNCPTPSPWPPRQTLPNWNFAWFYGSCGLQRLGRVFCGATLIHEVFQPNPFPAHPQGNPNQTLVFAAVATASPQKADLPPPRKTLFLARKRPTMHSRDKPVKRYVELLYKFVIQNDTGHFTSSPTSLLLCKCSRHTHVPFAILYAEYISSRFESKH